jgi:DNA-binding LacI/PurR family transcriptional regulator
VEGNWSSASGEQAIVQLLDQYPEMDAVFVANDQMALSVLQAACDRGIQVPQQLGVVGFDDIAESAYFCPALTTIRQDQQQVGCLAVREAINIIEAMHEEEGSRQPETTIIQPELITRKSTSAR